MDNPVSKSRRGLGYLFGKSERNFWFKIVRVVATTLVFTIIFYFLVLSINKPFWQWVATIATVLFSMTMGNPTARTITKSTYKEPHDFQYMSRAMLIVLLYGTIVWMFARFDVYSRINFGLLLVIFGFTKFVVFLLSDYLADKISFGG